MTTDDPSNTDRSTSTVPPGTNGLAVASLVLGITWLMWIGSILALVFGYIARSQIDRSPHSQGGRSLAVAGIVLGWVGVATLAVMVIVLMTGVVNMADMPMRDRFGNGDDFASNGQRIYMTATSDSGQPITYEEGPGDGMMSGMLTCADCHGPEGEGGERQMMMQTFHAPDIRWSALTGDHAEHDENGESADHPPYARETVRRAITRGIDSGGQPLDPVMPRWQMSQEDLADLVDYLRSLE